MLEKNYLTKEPRVLISAEKIQERIDEIADQINKEYEGKEVMAICILKGASLFFADMIRRIKVPLRCEFMAVSSYGNEKKSSGEVKLVLDAKYPLEGQHVIIFEDIVDSGLTLTYILNLLKARNPASIKLCSLLFKPECLKKPLEVDYIGFKIGNEFVLGYGLDYEGYWRGLPYVGVSD
jgi:hypoxanthine phosphoribosyltransferase